VALCLSALSLAACGPQWTTYVDGLRKEMGTDSIRCAEGLRMRKLTSAVHTCAAHSTTRVAGEPSSLGAAVQATAAPASN